MNSKIVEQKCKYFIEYVDKMILPSADEFFNLVDENHLKIYKTFSFNSILAHAIDYMALISNTMLTANKQKPKRRPEYVKTFDQNYMVEGAEHINNKFRLVDAINNSFKHVELDENRYPDLINEYGPFSFLSLRESNGKVFFKGKEYRFDYSRVVIRPIFYIFNCNLSNTDDVIQFINGERFGELPSAFGDYEYVPEDAIDRMIDHVNPQCMDCGEYGDDCDCSNFIYAGESGDFNPDIDPSFEFDDVMGQISGSKYK